jgi:two-component system cell cycle sensor histidine kinase/response regulator CckA
VYGIATRFGGHTTIDSEPGNGASVAVYFPAAVASAEPSPPPRLAPHATGVVDGTILLVEDDDGVRRVALRILEERGYDVIAASRPSEALRLAHERAAPLDLLLTDVVMPEMSGPKLAARLQEHQPGLPVVFASGYTDRPDELPPGSHFICKPFNGADLLAGVAAAWEPG